MLVGKECHANDDNISIKLEASWVINAKWIGGALDNTSIIDQSINDLSLGFPNNQIR